MRRYLFLLFFLINITCFKAFGQTTINVDLSGSPDTSTTITNVSRSGNTCSGNNCVVFIVKLNPGSDLLNVQITQVTGATFYSVNCGPPTPSGTPVCINGSTTDTVIFCKPGANKTDFKITASSSVKASGGTTLRQLCSGTLSVTGLTAASATWTSISPGAAGAYNSYLSCTQCTSTVITPAVGAPSSILYRVSGLNNCANSRSDTVRIYTVPPLTVSISPATAAICNNTPVTLTANITGGNPPFTYSWSGSGVGTSSSIIASTPGTYTVTVSDNTTGCPSVPQSRTVTTSPTPTVTSASSATICNSTAQNYTITSNVTGTTYSWSRGAVTGISNVAVSNQTSNPITEVLNNTTNAPVNVVYAITPTASGCPGPVFNRTVTVNPTPTITSASSATICNNTAQNYTITSNVTGTTYNWGRATVAGISNAAVSSQTGSTITESLTNTTSAPVNVIYVITPSANGCTGPAFNYTLTVNPTPIITSAATATICNSTAQSYTITGNVAGTTFTWGRATVTGISNAAIAGQTGVSITESLTNTTSAPVNATYIITPAANGCSGTPFNYTVTVNPTPTVTSASSATTCNNNAQNYTITSNVSGTTYSWGRATVTGISNAAVSGQTSNPITEVLNNVSNSPVTVTYIITPIANGCSGPTFNYTVTVNPTSTVTSATTGTTCNNSPQNYSITSNVGGTTFTWGRATVTGISNAAVSNQTTSTITETLVNTTNAPVSVVYVVTPSANGCAGTPFNYTVTVNPTPTVTSASSATTCNNNAQNYTITSNVSGTTYSWGRATVTGISNAAVSGQTSNPITETLVNTTNAPVSVVYVVTPSANGCAGTPFNYTVTVNPTSTVTSATTGTTCNNSPQNYSITSNVGGTTFTWGRATVTGISNAAVSNQTTSTITETLVNTTNAPVSVVYVVTPSANGCAGTPFNYTVTVNPTPTVTSASSATTCNNNAQNYTITSNVSGTTYSWGRATVTGISNAAVSGQTSNPITEVLNNVSNSPVTVTYIITPIANGCSGPTFNYSVTINPTVNPAFYYSSGTFCKTGSNPTPTIVSPSGGTFSSSAGLIFIDNHTGQIDLGASTLGTYNITFVTNTACSYSSVASITITNSPDATFSYNGPYCQKQSNPLPTFPSGSSAGVFSSSSSGLVFQNPTTGEIDLQQSLPGIYTVTNSIAASGGCAATSATNTITINPAATVNAGPNQTVCSGQQVTLHGTIGGGATSATWSGGTGTFANASSLNTIYTLGPGETSVTLSLTTDDPAGPCGPATAQTTITVNPMPSVTSALSTTICSGTQQNYTITSNVAGTTFTWNRAAVAGVSNTTVSGQTGNLITETLVNTTSAPVNVVYTIIPQANGCTGPTFSYTVTVEPTPTVTSAAGATVCNNAPQNYSITSNVAGTTFTWSRSAVAGIGNAAVSGQTSNTISESLINSTSTPVAAIYVITPQGNGCPGPAFNYTVMVNPTSMVSSAASGAICNSTAQNYVINSNVAGTTFTWGRAAVIGISNAAVSGQTSNPITESLVNTTNAPVTISCIITPVANGCSGTPFNYTLTVNPTPTVSSAATNTICNGTPQNYTITSTVSGATFTWSRSAVAGISNAAISGQTGNPITETLVNTTSAPVNVVYAITPSANGCNGTPINYTLTVSPTPTVTSASSATICNNTAQNYVLTSNVSGTTFIWGRAAVAGISNAAVSGQNSGSIAETLVNTTSAPVNVVYAITPSANDCPGTPFNYTATVNPTSTVTSVASATVCNNNSQNYKITGSVAGTTYNWSRLAVVGISNAAVSGQTANPISEVLNNTSNAPVTVTYVIIPIANGCSGTAFNYTVTVNPTTVITNAVLTQTVCSGGSSMPVMLTSNVNGASITWTATATAGVSGFNSTGNNVIPAQIIINPGSTIATVTYTIQPSFKGCDGTINTYTIQVPPKPAVPVLTSNSPICSSASLTLTTAAVAGATYNWNGPNGFSSNLQNPQIPNVSSAAQGNYNLTVTVNGCTSDAGTLAVAVIQTPAAPTAASNSPVCAGSTLNLTVNTISGATYSWTGPNGFVSSVQNPVINNAQTAASGTYSITVTLNGCTSAAGTVTAVVNAIPAAPILTSNSLVCEGTVLSLKANNIAGASYSWTGPNGFTSNAQNPFIPAVSLADSGMYIATTVVNGCSAQASIAVAVNQIIINPKASSNSPACTAYPIQLNATTFAGATYKWTGPAGFTSNQQNPVINNAALINSGRYTVIVTSTGCSVTTSAFTDVVVNQTPLAPTATTNSPICAGQPLQFFASNVNGATYIWTGPNGFMSNLQNPVIYNAAVAAAGKYSLSVTVNSCTSAITSTDVVIDKPAVVSAGSDQTVCANNTSVSLNGTISGGSTTGIWTTSGTGTFTSGNSSLIGTYIPSAADVAKGTVKLTLTATKTGTCLNAASITVTITVAPVVSAGKDIQICSNENIALNGVVSNATGGRWASTGTGVFNPSNADLIGTYMPSNKDKNDGKVTLTLTSTGNGNCIPVTSTMTATIVPAPVIDSMAMKYVLQKGSIVLQPTVTGTNLNYLWTPNLYLNNNTLKNPVFTGVGDITYTLTVTNGAGCISTAQLFIKVLKPIVIPNTFTPNGDGVNDTWIIEELANYPGATVRIFDRYGIQLLYSQGYGKPWDGIYNGKPVPFGVYYYLIDIKQFGGPLAGYITVIR